MNMVCLDQRDTTTATPEEHEAAADWKPYPRRNCRYQLLRYESTQCFQWYVQRAPSVVWLPFGPLLFCEYTPTHEEGNTHG